jgi:hypothetical protein
LLAVQHTRNEEIIMPNPRDPSEQPPMPSPVWAPEPPIKEPEPDQLPDETPLPNPDESRELPAQF